MLFDPKWQVKADPLTLQSLIAWLETKPPDEIYCYVDQGRSLAAQYNIEIGRKYAVYSLFDPPETDETKFDYALEWISCDGRQTFGATLSRARRQLAFAEYRE